MLKLKEVISQLNQDKYLEIENKLIKNKADNFLLLLKSYKNSNDSDKDIIKDLGISINSFYVLKTRLYDKIQESLCCNMYDDQEKSIKLLLKVPEICLNSPREFAITYLKTLEKELMRFDMHNELLVVYSSLKKLHLHSDKYFHYTNLYNKQVSFSLSLEKAEEFLGEFCRFLGQYDLSKSQDLLDKINFIKNEVNNIYSLCSSKQIELIKNLIELQVLIFCPSNKTIELSAGDLIQQTKLIFNALPETIVHKKWELVLDYLCFEYYYSIGSHQNTKLYFEKVNDCFENLLLYNDIGLVSHFLISKIKFCNESNTLDDLFVANKINPILFDEKNEVLQLSLCIYNSMIHFSHGKYKEAIDLIIDIQNEYVLKNYFYQYINIKLTLTYFYIASKELDRAALIAKSTHKIISRKSKIENTTEYDHVFYLLKLFDSLINKDSTSKYISKQRDLLILFTAKNHIKNEFIPHLIPELKRKYQI